MKVLLLLTLLITSCSSAANIPEKNLNKTICVRTTAYTHSERDHAKYGRKNAVGTKLLSGNIRSAAADWSVFPVGTLFKIENRPEVFVIDDYGSALVGTRTIDIYHTSKKAMRNWGVRYINITILKLGCYTRSAQILASRLKYSHTRKMFVSINNKGLAIH